MKSKQNMPSSGVVKVAKMPTVPLGERGREIERFIGGSVTAIGPEKREMKLLWDIPQRFKVAATFVPTRMSTVTVPAA